MLLELKGMYKPYHHRIAFMNDSGIGLKILIHSQENESITLRTGFLYSPFVKRGFILATKENLCFLSLFVEILTNQGFAYLGIIKKYLCL